MSVMEKELKEFSDSHSLSPRERDILLLLSKGTITFKDIASTLNLSPNTINNHFKSIFEKTKTKSKSELLASFLKHTMTKLEHCKYLHKRPNVLVVDDEVEICQMLTESLSDHGMKVRSECDSTRALEAIQNNHYDVVISDIRMPKLNGIELLNQIRQNFRYWPAVLFISGYTPIDSEFELMDKGAAGLIEKPIDMRKLFHLVMEQVIDGRADRNQYLRIDDKIPVILNEKLKLTIQNIGHGGIFIPLSEDKLFSHREEFETGKVISFQFRLPDSIDDVIRAKGEVVWQRAQPKNAYMSGLGVKFIDLDEKDRERIRDFVQLKKIVSFIPSGLKDSST